MFIVRDLVRIQEVGGGERFERILWIDEGNVICYAISVKGEKAKPKKYLISDLEKLYEEKLLSFERNDPFGFIFQDDSNFSESNLNKRDVRWECIEEIVLKEPDIYEGDKRGSLISETMERTGKTKRLIYKYLTEYWQRGKVKNALLPDYRKAGGKGKPKKLNNKNGRKKKFEKHLGSGVVITKEIEQFFQLGVTRYYHTTKKFPLAYTFKMILHDSFAESYRYVDGEKKPILVSPDKRPTRKQFRYWYLKNYSTEEKLRKRKGNRKYELEDRASLGSSVGENDGPGSKFQIDATVADVYLVSSYNRNWIIGRPVIYVVIDVFSRKVVGLYVGLEGPSWIGAMMALANTASDKVAYCRQNGIEITKEEWDCHYLPQTLIADRGELEGYNVDRLISAFGINVVNTPPYRGDWKGIVERHFRIIHDRVKPLLPGSIDKDALQRGDRDYRLDGTLTIHEFTKIVIKCVLYHNNSHWLEHLTPDKELISEEVPLIPREIWNWGIKNRSGKLRYYPEDIIKLHLLPTDKATVTYKGIEFKNMRYSCERAIREGWFGGIRGKSFKIPISYDPRDMGQIYLPSEDGMSYEVATLLDHLKETYSGKTLEEVVYSFDNVDLRTQLYQQNEEAQEESDLIADINHIVTNAKKQSKDERVKMSNAQRTKDIRENRAVEKENRRDEEAFNLIVVEPFAEKPTPNNDDDETKSPKEMSRFERLRKKQKENMGYARGS